MKIKSSINPRYFVLIGALFVSIIAIPSVFAVGKPDSIGKPEGVKRQQAQTRLTEAKLKACQARENAIKKRTEQLTRLATTMQEKFDAIAKRVEEYYTAEVVPSGKTVADYDSLVAEIQTKKGTVQTALTAAQSNAGSFACGGNDPKGQMIQFKDDMGGVKKALKDYRTSIKNLIVAVRSVKGGNE